MLEMSKISLWENKWSSDIVSYVSSSLHAIQCRAEARRERNGGLTGMFYKVLGGGRIRLWDGQARASLYFTIPDKAKGDIPFSADYMQGTRISFNSREDAIRFAERQGKGWICHRISEDRFNNSIRMGLLCPAGDSQTHSSEELQVTFSLCHVNTLKPYPYLLLSENYIYNPNKLRIARTK